MGRAKRDVPKGKFRLRVIGKPKPNKLYQINIEYTWNARIIRKATGITARYADWNPNANHRGELRSTYGEEYKRTNSLLNKRLDKIDADLVEYKEKHDRITVEVIKAILNNEPIMRVDSGKDFVEFAIERLNSKYNRNKIGYSRYKNGCSALKVFKEFLVSTGRGTYKSDGIYIGEMTCELLEANISWRKTVKGNSDATINHSLTPILDACRYASELGYIDRTTNANLQEMRIDLKPSIDEDTQKCDGRFLTKEQLNKLVEYYEKCQELRRKEFIEMFLFAFHACGLRVVDVMTLQWGHVNFEKKELRKIMIKTNKRHVIPLTEPALRILRQWQEKRDGCRYVFNLVKDDLNLDDAEALYKARNNATKCINQSLVVVGENIGLPFNLSMHVARHTFAVFALNKGLSMSVVSRLLGHGSTDVTEKVYARFLPETLASEVAKLKADLDLLEPI